MTIKEAKKEIVDYFNLDMTPHAENRLINILSSIKTKQDKVIETKYVYIYNDIQKKNVDINEEAQRVCELYDITLEQLKSRVRKTKFVSARVHLIREMRMNGSATMMELKEFLNMKDHSSVIHLCYDSKTRCMIQPLTKPRDIKKHITLEH
jgi:chromosomal replication initiation ATPase DnaA